MRMKRLMIVMMGLVLTLSASAQYRRPYYYSPNHGHSNYRHSSPVEVYGGLRLGAAFSTVSSDDRYLNGGSMKTGLDVGAVVGVQLGYRSPVFFETGLSYIEKGGEGRYNGSKFTYSLDYLEMPLLTSVCSPLLAAMWQWALVERSRTLDSVRPTAVLTKKDLVVSTVESDWVVACNMISSMQSWAMI